MDVDTDKFKSTHIKLMQKELKLRHDKIQQLNIALEVERADTRVLFVCWVITLMLYFIK